MTYIRKETLVYIRRGTKLSALSAHLRELCVNSSVFHAETAELSAKARKDPGCILKPYLTEIRKET